MTTWKHLSRPLRVAIAAPWLLLTVLVGTASVPAFRALMIDTANQPTADVSLSSTHWTGTLAAARLPASVVQQDSGGNVQLQGYLANGDGGYVVDTAGNLYYSIGVGDNALLADTSGNLYDSSGGIVADASGDRYYHNGVILADSSNNLYDGNGFRLADGSGNRYYSNGNLLADGSGYLYDSSGSFIADGSGNRYYGGGFPMSDAAGNTYFANGALLTSEAGNLYVSNIYTQTGDPSIDLTNSTTGSLVDDGALILSWTYSGVTVAGGLNVSGSISGDGSALTGVSAIQVVTPSNYYLFEDPDGVVSGLISSDDFSVDGVLNASQISSHSGAVTVNGIFAATGITLDLSANAVDQVGGYIDTSNGGGRITTANSGGSLSTSPVAFASRFSGTALHEGTIQPFNNSTVNTWGSTITGGGSYHVLGYYDGTNWTVLAK